MSALSSFLALPSLITEPQRIFSPSKLKLRHDCCIGLSDESICHLENSIPRTLKSTLQRNPILSHEECSHPNYWHQLIRNAIESGDFLLGLSIHACLVKSGKQNMVFEGNNIMNLYLRMNRLDQAQQVFDEMPMRNTITWTSLINGHSLLGSLQSAFQVTHEMHQSGERFNEHTCSVVLQACGLSRDKIRGEQLHSLIVKNGFQEDIFVGSALISMYIRAGSLVDAEMVFNDLDELDIHCWNSMILGYGKDGDSEMALRLFHNLLTSGFEPNQYTLNNVISACSKGPSFATEGQLHGLAVKHSFVSEVSVGNAIITMYGFHGLLEEAERFFKGMSKRNLITWTAILSGYVINGYSEKAIYTFKTILDLGIDIDSSCLATVIDACAECGNLKLGIQIHAVIVKLDFLSDAFVATALIDTYTKCSDFNSAVSIFNVLPRHNIASFNALLSRYMQTDGNLEKDIMLLLNQVRLTGMKLDSATLAQLLMVSANQASIVKGKCLHGCCIKIGYENDTIVSNSIVSMYGKCGSIDDACQMFSKMDNKDIITWNSMISAYALHGRGKEAISLFEEMERKEFVPDEVTLLSLLQASCYSGLYKDGLRILRELKRRFSIKLGVEHHACMVHFLGQAGKLSEAMKFARKSEFSSSPLLWRTLINACKLHGDLNIGRTASDCLLNLAPDEATSYMIVSDLYARGGMLEDSARMRYMMNNRNIKKEVGCSWIQINGNVHRFFAGATDHPRSREIYAKLLELGELLEQNGYVPIAYCRG